MKDTKKDGTQFFDPTRWVKTRRDGRLDLRHKIAAHYEMLSYPEPGEYRFEDKSGNLSGLEVVKGITGAAGKRRTTPHPVALVDSTTVAGTLPKPTKGVISVKQLPSGLTLEGRTSYQFFRFGTEESFLIQPEARSLLPATANEKKTFHFKFIIPPPGTSALRTNKAVITFAEPEGATVSQAFFTLGFDSETTLQAVFHDQSGGSGYIDQGIDFASSGSTGEAFVFADVFVTPSLDENGNASFDNAFVYRQDDGRQEVYVTAPVAGTAAPLDGVNGTPYGAKPSLIMGYGELTGGVNETFTGNDDWMSGLFGLSLTVYNGRLTEKEMRGLVVQQDAETDRGERWHRSGIESEPVMRTLRKRDRQRAYPSIPSPVNPNRTADPFNDMHSFDRVKQPVVYPEMIPVSMYSGSVAFSKTIKGDGGPKRAEATITINATSGSQLNSFDARRIIFTTADAAEYEFMFDTSFASGSFYGGGSTGNPFRIGIDGITEPAEYAGSLMKAVNNHIGEGSGWAAPTPQIRARIETPGTVIFKHIVYDSQFGFEDPNQPITLDKQLSRARRQLGGLPHVSKTNFTGGEFGLYRGSFGIEYLDPTGSASPSSKADEKGFQVAQDHHTPLHKRIIADAVPNEAAVHMDSYKFNRYTANEAKISQSNMMRMYHRDDGYDVPEGTSKFPNILNRNPLTERTVQVYASRAYNSGSIEPFDESKVSLDAGHINQPAVSPDVYEGLQQKLGDHLVIEIPLNPASSTTFGVDRHNNFSMGYFNFADSKWDAVGQIPGLSGSTNIRQSSAVSNASLESIRWSGLIGSCSLGFAGTTGFAIYPENGSLATADLKHRGSPTDLFGFPADDKYRASRDQLLDMSKYIDAPFVLERWEIQFEAEVEDSGPESLGYVMPARSELGDFSRIREVDGDLLSTTQYQQSYNKQFFKVDPVHVRKSNFSGRATAASEATTGSYDFTLGRPGVYWPGWRAQSLTNAEGAIDFVGGLIGVGRTITIDDGTTSLTYTAAVAEDTDPAVREFDIFAIDPALGDITLYAQLISLRNCIEATIQNATIDVDLSIRTDNHMGVVMILSLKSAGADPYGTPSLSTTIPSSDATVYPIIGGGGNTTAFRLAHLTGSQWDSTGSSIAGTPTTNPRPDTADCVDPNSLRLKEYVIPSSRYAQREYHLTIAATGSDLRAQRTLRGGLAATHATSFGWQQALADASGSIPYMPLSGNVGMGIPPDVFRSTDARINRTETSTGRSTTVNMGSAAGIFMRGALTNGFSISRGVFLGASPVYNVAPHGELGAGATHYGTSTNAGGPGRPLKKKSQWGSFFRPSLFITGNYYPPGDAGYYYLSSGTMMPHGGTQLMITGTTYDRTEAAVEDQPTQLGVEHLQHGPKYPILWSGRNGQPTGSLTTGSHRENVQVVATNGVPFWRCDTFFLLRQFKGDGKDVVKTKPVQSSQMTTNYASAIGEWAAPANATALAGLGSGYGAQNTKPGHSIFTGWKTDEHRPTTIDAGTVKDRYVPHVVGTAPTGSVREMITYSQMATYGYAAATAAESGAGVTQAIKVGNSKPSVVATDKAGDKDADTHETGEYGINIETGYGVSGPNSNQPLKDTHLPLIGADFAGTDVPSTPSQAVVPVTTSSYAFGGGSIVNAPGIIVNSGSHDHWSQYGTFHSDGEFYLGPFQGPIAGISQDRKATAESWLAAGLSRDLNVQILPGQGGKQVFASQAFRFLSAPGWSLDNTAVGGYYEGDDTGTRGEGNSTDEQAVRSGFVFTIDRGGSARTGGRYIEDKKTYRIWFKYGSASYTGQWSSNANEGPQPGVDKPIGDKINADYNYAIDWSSVAQGIDSVTVTYLRNQLWNAFATIGDNGKGPKVGVYPSVRINGALAASNFYGATGLAAGGGLILSASNEYLPSGFKVIHQHQRCAEFLSIEPVVTRDGSLNFTVLTASIASTDGAGAHSAAEKLGANIHRRNFLSTGSFRISAPVRKAAPSIRSAPTYLATYNVAGAEGKNIGIKESFARKQVVAAGILDAGYTPGKDKDGIYSGRAITKRSSADTATDDTNEWTPTILNGNGNQGIGGEGDGLTIPTNWSFVTAAAQEVLPPMTITQVSGSDGTKVADESLYVLLPEDKIILGFQPAQRGGNPGNPQIMNPNIRPFASLGVQAPVGVNPFMTGSSADKAAAGAALFGDSQVSTGTIANHNARLMTGNKVKQYEPAHSFTMKKGKAKLVLYGTLMRDSAYEESSLNQNLTTNEVHQTVGAEPVLDQFLVSSRGEYTSSPLAAHITGSTNLEQQIDDSRVYSRGVKLRHASRNLSFSGSLQRFVTLTDQSEIRLDTLLPDLGVITKNLGLKTLVYNWGSSERKLYKAKRAPVLNFSNEGFAYAYVRNDEGQNPITSSAPQSAISEFNAFSSWTHSFPFEEKWGAAERMVEITPGLGLFGDTGGDALYLLTRGKTTNFRSPGLRWAELAANEYYSSLSVVTQHTSSVGQNWASGMAPVAQQTGSLLNEAGDPVNDGATSWRIPKNYIARFPTGYGHSVAGQLAVSESADGVRMGNRIPIQTAFQPLSVRQAGTEAPAMIPGVKSGTASSGSFFNTSLFYGNGRDTFSRTRGLPAPGGGITITRRGSLFGEYGESLKRTRMHYSVVAGFWNGIMSVTGSPAPILVGATGVARGGGTGSGSLATGSRLGDLPKHFQRCLTVTQSVQMVQLDHPAGWKYGLENCFPLKTVATFRPDRYGQLRDMLEQRKYTKFFDEGLSENIRGQTDAAVSCIFVDINGLPVGDPTETTCGNLSTAMTSSRPFIEGDVETRIIKDRFISIT